MFVGTCLHTHMHSHLHLERLSDGLCWFKALFLASLAMNWLQLLLWPGDSLTVWRDPPPPGLTLVELLLVSTVWGRQWYFVALKLTGRRRRRGEEENKEQRRRRQAIHQTMWIVSQHHLMTALNGWEMTPEVLQRQNMCFNVQLYGYIVVIRIIITIKKTPIINLCSVFSVLFLHYSYFMHHKVLSTTGFRNCLFYTVVVLFCINLYMLSLHISWEQFTGK